MSGGDLCGVRGDWRNLEGVEVRVKDLATKKTSVGSRVPRDPVEKSWPKVRLGDVGVMTRGSGIKRCETLPQGKPCIRYGEIYTSFDIVLDRPRSFVSNEVYDKALHIKRGDLVFTLTGENQEEIGKTLAYLGDEEIAAGGDLAVWSNHGCDPMYLAYLMYSPKMLKAKADASNGNIIVHLSVKKVQQIEVVLPPLSTQREIVARLEKELGEADKLAAKFKRVAELADDAFKAELDETFKALGDNSRRDAETRRVRLGDVCEVLDSKRKPITKKNREPGSIPYYGATGIVDYVKDYIFDERLVLLGEDGAKWGPGDNSAFIIEGKSWVNNHAHVIRVCSDLSADYLVAYLNFADLSPSITGVTVPKLNQQRMCDIVIPLPSLPAQRAIVAKLDAAKEQCEKLKAAAMRGLAAAENLRKAILAEAFEQ